MKITLFLNKYLATTTALCSQKPPLTCSPARGGLICRVCGCGQVHGCVSKMASTMSTGDSGSVKSINYKHLPMISQTCDCVCCGNDASCNGTSLDPQLSSQLRKLAGVNVAEGLVCRNCKISMKSLQESLDSFSDVCVRNRQIMMTRMMDASSGSKKVMVPHDWKSKLSPGIHVNFLPISSQDHHASYS